MKIHYFFTSLLLFWRSVSSSFTDVTERVGIGAINGYLAAFGDFNGDKKTDLFVVTDEGQSLDIFLWNDQNQEFTKGATKITLRNETIVNTSPSDFDGDGQLDVMITSEKVGATPASSKTVYVFWGNLKSLGANVSFSISDQPLIMDANGDLLPDLFGMVTTTNSTFRAYWISKGSARDFQVQPQISSKGKKLDPIRVPHSNAFLDLSGDFTADLFITTQSSTFELWQNKDGNLVYSQDINLPEKVIHLGQSTFADIDGDGVIDHLLPICTTSDCEESHIYVHSKDKWWHILSNGQNPVWKFVPLSSSSHGSHLFPLMTIRTGDYNMDGFPDAVVILAVDPEGVQNFKEVVVLLENIPCEQDRDCFQQRTFSIHWKELMSLEGAVLATFFDLYENGKNSIVVVTKSYDKDPPQYRLHAIRNDLYTDTCFLKVIVLGGQCFSSCPHGNLPYGVNQVGPFIKYSTTTTDGKPKLGSAAQLSQSAYFSLQCPYTVFGLGRTPNFVDELVVGMPRGNRSPERVRSWPSIIPNSQVIIIPYPADNPSSWTAKLFLTPSKLVLLTGLSLLGICVMIGLIILLLYLKEKREDQKEKRQDAHKFHFDAM